MMLNSLQRAVSRHFMGHFLATFLGLFLLISLPLDSFAQLTSNQSGKLDRSFGTNGYAPIIAGRDGSAFVTVDGTAFAASAIPLAA